MNRNLSFFERLRVGISLAVGLLAGLIAVPGAPDVEAAAPCPAPAPVCSAAGQVFAVQSFNPAASATRVGPDLLVTNRHVVANQPTAMVRTRDGVRLTAKVVPSSYPGDLILLRTEGLPPGDALPAAGTTGPDTALRTIGYDVGRDAVRVYPPGRAIAQPAAGKPLARLHHDAPSHPGNSGGALVDDQGHLVAVIAAGGEGRHDAVPVSEIERLKALSGPAHQKVHDQISLAYRQCMAATDAAQASRQPMSPEQAVFLGERCRASGNRQLLDLAAQVFGRRGQFDQSIALFETALDQDPNALNTRLGLVVALHLARRYADEVPHLKALIEALPADVQVLRFAIQAGAWGGAPALADMGMALLKTHHPKLAPLAERFRNAPPPRPQGR